MKKHIRSLQELALKSLFGLSVGLSFFAVNTSSASPRSFPVSSKILDIDAQEKTDINRAGREIFDYFQGEWSGIGEFASGKSIEATVSFIPELDGNWLVYKHVDHEPNKFQSIAFWGIERQNQFFTMMIVDNFKSIRRFQTTGFQQNALVFEGVFVQSSSLESSTPNRRERFTFLRLKEDAFKMTYESNTNNQGWKLGDWILFQRKRK